MTLCFTLGFAHAGDTEEKFWESVLNGNVQEEYELYLKQYPQGRHAEEARRSIEARKMGANRVNVDEITGRSRIIILANMATADLGTPSP